MDIPKYLESRGWEWNDDSTVWEIHRNGISFILDCGPFEQVEIQGMGAGHLLRSFKGYMKDEEKADIILGALGIT